jgi:ureidoacrylate peracid hydrolase
MAGGAGVGGDRGAARPDRALSPALRAKGGTYISAQFTLVPGPGRRAPDRAAPQEAAPVPRQGRFRAGQLRPHAWSMRSTPADYTVEKVAYSAFYQTRLEYILTRASGIDTLIVGGIVTNGGVASTVRDAHLRNIHTDPAVGRLRGVQAGGA